MLDEQTPNTSNGVDTLNSELEGYPLAKVIQNVGKIMENGKKLLDASREADKTIMPKPLNSEDRSAAVEAARGAGEKNPIIGNGIHAYEVQKIELLEDHKELDKSRTPRTTSNSIAVAKLLQNVEKSYEKGKKVLLQERLTKGLCRNH